MSLDDFDRCTPSEFAKTVECWREREERAMKLGWEQTRFLATAILQPYSKKSLKPEDVARFPWEEKSKPSARRSTYERMKELENRLKKSNGENSRPDAGATSSGETH